MFNDKQQAVSSVQRVGQVEIQSAIVEDVYRVSATIKAKTVAMCRQARPRTRTKLELNQNLAVAVAVDVAASL